MAVGTMGGLFYDPVPKGQASAGTFAGRLLKKRLPDIVNNWGHNIEQALAPEDREESTYPAAFVPPPAQPLAGSMLLDDAYKPMAFTPSSLPTPLPQRAFQPPQQQRAFQPPPETVEATRLYPEELASVTPPRPIVEATVMRRGRPGSGEFGEAADLTPASFRRYTPMSVSEAEQAGLVTRGQPFRFEQIGRAPGGVNAGMGHSLDATNRATMDATREARWGQSGPTRAALFSSVETVDQGGWRGRGGGREERVRVPYSGPARGVQGRVDAILEAVRGQKIKEQDAETAVRTAQGTPQAVAGYGGTAVYTPPQGGAPGRWDVEGRPAAATGRDKAMTPKEAADLMLRRAKLLQSDGVTPLNPEAAKEVERLNMLLDSQGYGEKAESSVKKDAGGYVEGQTGIVNGRRYVRRGGKWVPAQEQ